MDAGFGKISDRKQHSGSSYHFKDWIAENTGGVIIVQLRDRIKDNWQHPLEIGSVTDIIVKPATMLQHNWYKLQDYFQTDQYSYLKDSSKQYFSSHHFYVCA
jgi:hypothetical protein